MFRSDAYHPDHFSCTFCRCVRPGLVQSRVGPHPGRGGAGQQGAGRRWRGLERAWQETPFPGLCLQGLQDLGLRLREGRSQRHGGQG